MLGNPEPIRKVREKILPLAEGRVLEIGVGPGVNFVHYDPARVTKVYALEPNPRMIRLAERERGRTRLDVEFLKMRGEAVPLPDGSVDTVVSTFTFCTIPDVLEAIRTVERLLRSGGKLIFFEHGRSPDPRVRRWQERWEPVNRRVLQGCHLARDIPALLTQGGLHIDQINAGYVAPFPKPWTYCWWGTAFGKP